MRRDYGGTLATPTTWGNSSGGGLCFCSHGMCKGGFSSAHSLCLAYVTGLVERLMLKKDYRAEAFREYQRTTSVWIPWFKITIEVPKAKTS